MPPLNRALTAQADGAGIAQVLIAIGELKTQVAVIDERLKAVPDHEGRIRALETARNKLIGLAAGLSLVFSGLGTWIAIVLTSRR